MEPSTSCTIPTNLTNSLTCPGSQECGRPRPIGILEKENDSEEEEEEEEAQQQQQAQTRA